jgi:inner membrane protein
MSPATHLFASWLVAAAATDNARDRRVVTLCGIAPDLDGLGVAWDLARQAWQGGQDFQLYQQYHHFLLHGALAAVVLSALAACLARRRWRVAGLAFLLVHLHLLCDLLGSRGPSAADVWPIWYLAPFSHAWTYAWAGQWALDSWPNRLLSVALFAACFGVAIRRGYSVVELIGSRADGVFVSVVRRWWDKGRGIGKGKPGAPAQRSPG